MPAAKKRAKKSKKDEDEMRRADEIAEIIADVLIQRNASEAEWWALIVAFAR